MPELPFLYELPARSDMITQFGGYNHNPRIADNEFDDMSNMSSSSFPILSTRNKRGVLTVLNKPNGIAAKSNLFWVEGTRLYYNGTLVEDLVLEDSPKQMVSMGAYLLIWPDKVYFNTADSTFGKLEAEITINGDVVCTLVKPDGTEYGDATVSDTEPYDPANGDLWIDTREEKHVLKQYSEATGAWVPIPTTYVKIAAENIGALFSKYDGVNISGLINDDLNGEKILYGVGEHYIIVQAIIDQTISQTGSAVTVKREVPDMDFLVECNNRVWGCNSDKNEIYACKLGDPKNWRVFMGVATDSYAVNVGTDGDFTAAATYFGQVLFFKEDYLHKITGNQPANYQITTIPCRGVERGSEKSLALVNERLFYKARTAICAYDGALPVTVSEPLGNVRYTSAVGGGLRNKYYISMKDTAGAWHMFVFDTALGLWHREDNTHALDMATHEGELFYIDADTGAIMSVNGRLSVHQDGVQYDAVNGGPEDNFQWYVETGDWGMGLPEEKYFSKIMLRLEVDEPTTITVGFKYDSNQSWSNRQIVVNTPKRTVKVPIIPQRCDHMRMKISGTVGCRIYSISRVVEGGGDGRYEAPVQIIDGPVDGEGGGD